MKKFFNLFLVVVIAITITSCSSNSKKIQDKWWYEVEKIGDDIIKFTSDGKIQNINDREVLIYEISGEEIKMKLRDYEKESELAMKSIEQMDLGKEPEKVYKEEKWTISSVTDNELILKNGEKSKTFRLATDQDFFVGKWEGTKEGVEVRFRFTKKNKVELKVKGADEEKYIYSFNDNKVIIDNEPLEFTLSEDKNNLILKGKETINLVRRGI
jgi:hypothetical protein